MYNVTAFLEEHPYDGPCTATGSNHTEYSGGEELILDYAGKDATDMFLDVSHSYTAYKLLKTLLVGTLAD